MSTRRDLRADFVWRHRRRVLASFKTAIAVTPATAFAEIEDDGGFLTVCRNLHPEWLGDGKPFCALLDGWMPGTLTGWGDGPNEALDDLMSGARHWDGVLAYRERGEAVPGY
jgi:hypothetical protein